jgi:hypothetical protein
MHVGAEPLLLRRGEFLDCLIDPAKLARQPQVLTDAQFLVREHLFLRLADAAGERPVRATLNNPWLRANKLLEAVQICAAIFNRPFALRRNQSSFANRLVNFSRWQRL